jgi:hypothetical protein
MRTVLLAWALSLFLGSTAEGQTVCGGSDGHSQHMINGLRHLMGADPHLVAERSASQIPLVHPDSIALVTSDSVCTAMATAYGAAYGSPSSTVYVVKVGGVYLVRDPLRKVGEYLVDMIINPLGVVLARLTG